MNLLILLFSLPKDTLYTYVGKSTIKGTETSLTKENYNVIKLHDIFMNVILNIN